MATNETIDPRQHPAFASIIETSPGDIERPKPIPPGSYIATVMSHEYILSSQKGTPGVRFQFALTGALDDVDPNALDAAGGVDGKVVRSESYWLTKDSLFRLKDLWEHAGMDPTEWNDIVEANEQLIGLEILAKIINVPDEKDPTRIYTNVERTASAA